MQLRTHMAAILPLALLLLVLAACGTDQDEAEQAPPAEETVSRGQANATAQEPVTGGRILFGALGDATNMIPPLATDSFSHEVADHLYVAPLKYDKDLNIVTEAAESYEVLEEGRLLRFTLKKGILWDDGTELTAEDMAFTYRMMVDPKTPTAYAEDYLAVKEFKVLDRYSFEVRYDKPFARSLITWMHDILPRHALEGEDLLDTKYSREPLSAGPYRLKEWIPGSKVVLEARDEYFEGRPYLDQLVYRIIPDLATMFLELKAGNLDMMGLTPQQYLFQTKGDQWERDYRKFKYLAWGYTYLGYNLKSPLFRDVRVRRAINYAIDKEELVKGVLLGLGATTTGPYKPGTWVYNERIEPYGHDAEQAKALLAEAGWTDSDGDGVLDKGGQPFAFTVLTNQGNDQRIKTATIIQSRLKAVGIRMDIRTVEWAAFLKEFVDKGRFDAVIMGWNITQDPDIYDVWHSSKAVPGGLNFVHYKSEEADELLQQARHTLDREKRKEYYDRFQEVLHRDQPYCFLFVQYSLPIVHARFRNVNVAPAGIGYNLNRWWVPEDQQRFRMQQ
jgi:peptide/nickel transport system substrate-binding protein